MQKIKIIKKISAAHRERRSENIDKFSLDENNFFITCQAGVESLVKKECEKI